MDSLNSHTTPTVVTKHLELTANPSLGLVNLVILVDFLFYFASSEHKYDSGLKIQLFKNIFCVCHKGDLILGTDQLGLVLFSVSKQLILPLSSP